MAAREEEGEEEKRTHLYTDETENIRAPKHIAFRLLNAVRVESDKVFHNPTILPLSAESKRDL